MTMHMEIEEARFLQSQINTNIADIQNALAALNGIRFQLDAWSGAGKDDFIGWYDVVTGQLRKMADEASMLHQGLAAEIDEWIEMDQRGAARIAAISVAMVGVPAALGRFTQKQQGNTCALYAQGTAMEALTGRKFDIEEAQKLGLKAGYFNVLGFEGTLGLGKYWDANGIPYDAFQRNGSLILGTHSDADFSDAANFLVENIKANHAVIVGVEADTLYDGIAGIKDNYFPFEGHAVWVTGLRTDITGQVTHVIMNDSGVGHATEVPISNFMRAWETKNYQAIASKAPMKVP